MVRLILASASPRRRELLLQMGISDFTIRPALHEIEADDLPPGEAVQAIALAKGQAVAETVSAGELVLAADTEVWFEGKLLGKPRDEADAIRMLRRLSGAKHTVYSGVALILDGKAVTGVEVTEVYFRDLSDGEIEAYVATGEPLDKAGAYGIQGRAAHFVRRIEGDVYNVIGLPLCLVHELTQKMGVILF